MRTVYTTAFSTYPGTKQSGTSLNSDILRISTFVDSTWTWSDQRSSLPCIDWKQKIANHSSATTDRDVTFTIVNHYRPVCSRVFIALGYTGPSGSEASRFYAASTTVVGAYVPNEYTVPSSVITNVKSRASAILMKREAKRVVTVDGKVFLGEIRETAEMLRHPLKSLVTGIQQWVRWVERYYKKCRRLGKPPNMDFLNATYLEYTFGWAPFLNDVAGIAEALAAEASDSRYANISAQARVKGASVDPTVREGTRMNGLNAFEYPYRNLYDQQYEVSCRAQSQVQLALDDNPGARLLQATNLDGRNPFADFVVSGWELIPGSFLLSYVSNIDIVMKSRLGLRANPCWTSLSTRVTVRTKSVCFWAASPPDEGAPGMWNDQIIRLHLDQPAIVDIATKRITRQSNLESVVWELDTPSLGQIANLASIMESVWKLIDRAGQLAKRMRS